MKLPKQFGADETKIGEYMNTENYKIHTRIINKDK